MDHVKEFFELLWVNLVTSLKNMVELGKVARRYYFNAAFFKADQALLWKYLFQSPFRISKDFLQKKGEKEVYAYGETPLTSLEHLSKQCRISKEDVVFELGCGRGRACFWLNAFVGCKTVGIEQIPEFVKKANEVKEKCHLANVEFLLQNMLEADFSAGTVFYLYGTCYGEAFIQKLIEKFEKLPSGTKIITVSYPLTDYTDKRTFEVMKRFSMRYPWGDADVYLQVLK